MRERDKAEWVERESKSKGGSLSKNITPPATNALYHQYPPPNQPPTNPPRPATPNHPRYRRTYCSEILFDSGIFNAIVSFST